MHVLLRDWLTNDLVLTKKKYADPNVLKTFLETLLGCQDTVAQLERICNTPLPFAYQAHLRASLWRVSFLSGVCVADRHFM